MEDRYVLWPGWETVRLLGRGSFGAVYEIQRDIFGEVEKAALKVISLPQNESDIDEMYGDGYDEESITRTFEGHLKSIVEEYSLMQKLKSCSNVVNCDDINYTPQDNGIGWDIFIKMELLTPLLKALPAQIPEETVRKIGKDICNALIACKEYDVIHRDIRPANIYVSKRGYYVLDDFTVSNRINRMFPGLVSYGRHSFWAPELYSGQPYSANVDIYSLGVVMYWMLNERRMPFLPLPPQMPTREMEYRALERRYMGEQLPPPAHGSEELKAIVLKACTYDPKERYQSAQEMLQALESVHIEKSSAVELAPAKSLFLWKKPK